MRMARFLLLLVALSLGSSSEKIVLGDVPEEQDISFAITLPLRNEPELDALLVDLYDPTSSSYNQFLTADEFKSNFGPTDEQVAALTSTLTSQSLNVVQVSSNNLLIRATGKAKHVNKAFNVKLGLFEEESVYFAPHDGEESIEVPQGALAVVGLSNRVKFKHQSKQVLTTDKKKKKKKKSKKHLHLPTPVLEPPANIANAYQFPEGVHGNGQVAALVELDEYLTSDITTYLKYFNISSSAEIVNVYPVGQIKLPAYNAEVALDIELILTVAPNLEKLLVYMAPNSLIDLLAMIHQIATDNLAKTISTSWGVPEAYLYQSYVVSEGTAYKQMASQGQSMFAAAGDRGAFAMGGKILAVQNPASQPYVTGVGGTELSCSADGTYISETTWWIPALAEGGGGGISSLWTIPSYQVSSPGSATSLASTTYRNVPDVSLDSDPYTGYPIVFKGKLGLYGGTSCAAPIWAGFMALVNEKRVSEGKKFIGFANPTFYSLGSSANYETLFHDIRDGSTNGHFPAVTGYDLATGWGSMQATNLYNALVAL